MIISKIHETFSDKLYSLVDPGIYLSTAQDTKDRVNNFLLAVLSHRISANIKDNDVTLEC